MKLKFDLVKHGLLLCLLSLSSFAFAQRTVMGTITDSDSGDALIGASVLAKGSDAGTVTDIDGKFSLDVPDGVTELEVSYTGFSSQTITLGSSNVVNVNLAPGALLDEVVVIGYGSVKKSDLTGAVSAVSEKDFNKGLMVTPDQLIQGKATGVQVLANSGQPGVATTVRIRGNSSIRAGNNPLWVVDGVQLSGSSSKPGANTGELGATPGANPLNYLNPNDIASIQVLKDASSTAIYGSRGANGVIIITTKRGEKGSPQISFNTSVGTSSILNKYDVLSGDEYRQALSDYGQTGGDFGSSVDAMDEILRSGIVQNHGMSISGGTKDGSYRIGLSYLDQEGIVEGNDLNRLTANIAGGYKFLESERLGIDFNLIASNTKENGPAVSTNAGFRGSLIGNALQWNPTHPLYESDGSPVIVPQFGEFTNPVALLQAYEDRSNTVDIIASISPYFKLTDNLTYKFNYNVTQGNGNREGQIASWINIQSVQGEGLAWYGNKATTNQILTHTLNWDSDLTSTLGLNLVAGYEYQKLTESGFGFNATGFITDDFDYTNILQNSVPGQRQVNSFSNPDAELQSYFARGIFDINDRFLVQATVRADGSSKFGENNRYGVFPSVSAAWNLHNEDFLSGGNFDNLKLRASWGRTGNSEFPAGASQDRYGFTQGGLALENVANSDLKWETSTTLNIGLDFALMDYRLTGSIDYFNKDTEDLLFQFPTIQPAPAGLYWINLDGNVINSGVELGLNADLVRNDNFTWDLGVNLSFLDNVIENYDGPNVIYGQLFGQGISGATIMRLESGQPLHSFYVREHLEIGDDGQSVYADNEALSYLGNPNPSTLVGISTGLTFGDLSLGINMNGAYGHDIYNNTKNSVIPIGNLGTRNIDANLVGQSQQEAISNAIKSSSRYIESGDYMKLSNVTLAYNLGNLGNTINNARIYVTGQNLAVFTNYSGFDPEVNTVNEFNGIPSFGVEYIPYPSARTIIVGANFSF